MSRRLFAAGCWVLVATGLAHALGHYGMMSEQGDTEAEKQLLSLIRANPQDMGLGFVRSMFDIVAGFSLAFVVLPLGIGLMGLVTLRHEGRAPGLLRQVSIVYAGIYGDEPTSGLDPEAAQQVNDLIADLANQNGQTVVLATHNLTEAQRLCDRVAVMNRGKILAMGSLDELSRKLWPVTWVDVVFHVKPKDNVADKVKTHRGVIQVSGESEAMSVQVEKEDVIPDVVRYLVEQGESILKVNPRDYTLEDIYFALQAGES